MYTFLYLHVYDVHDASMICLFLLHTIYYSYMYIYHHIHYDTNTYTYTVLTNCKEGVCFRTDAHATVSAQQQQANTNTDTTTSHTSSFTWKGLVTCMDTDSLHLSCTTYTNQLPSCCHILIMHK